MGILTPVYATREDVKRALDVQETARSNGQVDRAIEAASRTVEGVLHRRFYPELDTRNFDWPNSQRARPWRLWLDQHELISVTTLSAGGVTIPSTDFFLEPNGSGPPFTRVEIDLDSPAAFSSGGSHQQAIVITGVYGYRADETPAGALAEDLDAVETGVDVTDSATIGVGDLIKVDAERMLVTGTTMLDTGQNTGGALTASNANVTVPVTTGTAYAVDETILIDAERMLIVDIAGNNLIVKRAWDGSVLAVHNTGADIFAARTLTVTRGALGTTPAAHATSTAIARHLVPGLVRDATVALALNQLLQEQAGYARTAVDSRPAIFARTPDPPHRANTGRGVSGILTDVYTAYGRKARTRGV